MSIALVGFKVMELCLEKGWEIRVCGNESSID